MTTEATNDLPLWKTDRRLGEFPDGPPRRGVSDLAAVALVVLELDVVRRSTIRALCPAGGTHHETGAPVKNPISNAIRGALKRFEHLGYITREGNYVHVHDRQGLRAWVDRGEDLSPEHAARLLDVEEAARQINADLESGTAISGWTAEMIRRNAEIRLLELRALARLMQSGPGTHPGGRGTVRLIATRRPL